MALMGSSGCVDTSVGFDSGLSVQLYAVKCNRVFLSLCVYMCTICVFWVEEGIAN